MFSAIRQQGLIAVGLMVLLIVTRGSHVGSAALLPDATLATMLLGGFLLRRGAWFATLFATCVAVDAFAVGVAGVSSYCLSPAYWALVPTYGVMWLGGRWLASRAGAFSPLPYMLVAVATTSLAFVISTHSFYLFSGRFPEASLLEVMQHGWEYFPAYLGYTMMYLAAAWVVQRTYRSLNATRRSQTA